MKKIITLLSSFFFILGIKAQDAPPAVKKETIKPGTFQPGEMLDTLKKDSLKQVSKTVQLKKPATLQMKEKPVQMKESPVQMKESPLKKESQPTKPYKA